MLAGLLAFLLTGMIAAQTVDAPTSVSSNGSSQIEQPEALSFRAGQSLPGQPWRAANPRALHHHELPPGLIASPIESSVGTFATNPVGIVYTCATNIGATICNTLNSTIAGLYSSAFSNANASIFITFGSTGLGESLASVVTVSYSSFRSALVASVGGINDTTAISSSVPPDNPFGSNSLFLTNANARALGFGANSGVTSGGSSCNLSASNCYDGVITISSSVNSAGQLYFRTGNITSNQYDFYSVVEHETDEILGTVSCAFGCTSKGSSVFRPADLFRYHSNGTRALNAGSNSASCSTSSSTNACFSLDGVNMIQQYNNIDSGEDAGDWLTNCSTPLVQNAAACPGQAFIDIAPSKEIALLDVVGFTSTSLSVQAPTAVTSEATSISTSAATLGGSVNPNGVDTKIWFQYSTNSAMFGSISTTQQDIGQGKTNVAVSTPIIGLSGGTTYYFQAMASSSAGNTSGSMLSFTTPAPAVPPSVTTNAASSITQTTATLNGTSNPNSVDTQVWFNYATNSSMIGATSTAQQYIGAGSASVAANAAINGLSANTTYFFQAMASSSAGSTSGSILSFTTAAPSVPPSVTTNAASSITQTTATLNGTFNPNGVDTHVWFIYATNSSMTGATSTAQQYIGAGSTSVAANAAINGLSANTTYFFQAWASNSVGSTPGAVTSFTTSAPLQPDLVITSLTAPNAAISGGTIGVSLTVKNQGAGAAGAFIVELYFSTSPTLSVGTIDTGFNCSFAAGLAAGASSFCNSQVTIPALIPGAWYFGAIADPSNLVSESNHTNNTRVADSGQIVISLPTYSISGRITASGASLSGATVTLSGSQNGSAVTDASGNYSFNGLSSGGNFNVTPALSSYTFSPTTQTFSNLSGNQTANFAGSQSGNVTISGQVTSSTGPVGGVAINVNGSASTSAISDTSGRYSFVLPMAGTYTISATLAQFTFSAPVTLSNVLANQTVNFTAVPVSGMQFVPVTPCRVADTRAGAGFSGFFGPPSMNANTARNFPIASSACGIPANAAAYSINVTAVPKGPLGVLSIWPAGQPMPNVSTLNSYGGTVVANAAIVPAGASGAISIFVSDATDVLFDINGYFIAQGGYDFHTVTPCRVADTRAGAGFSGSFGSPGMNASSARSFPIPSSSCGIPASAGAYSFNFTAVPPAPLGFLTTWPTGKPQPNASTLNSYDGSVVANAAIVPAGTNGAISVYVSDPSNVLFDVNGYFSSTAGLKFYPVTPCRVADTRGGAFTGPFGAPTMTAGATRLFPVPSSTCGIPATAMAYSLNVTVVPKGYLGYLSIWPAGESMPVVSTLNSYSGTVVANAAIVPAGTGGAINIYVTDPSDVLFDINGYFAP